jgi:hypothetical protein
VTSWQSIATYNPLFVSLTGLLTLVAIFGSGIVVLRVLRFSLPSPWHQVLALLTGTQAMSLGVQVIAMGGLASRQVLAGWWLSLLLAGLSGVYLEYRERKGYRFTRDRGLSVLPAIVTGIALLASLLAAIAPSTKIDELYYHMLVPARIVHDQALVFYRLPWEGAVMPHMIYPIALTPLHAIGFPDAGNVVSWGFSLFLVWFGWTLVSGSPRRLSRDYIFAGLLVIGMHPAVWYVTGGSFAMGDLATAVAVVALLFHRDLLDRISPVAFTLMISFLALCSVSSKVSMIPVAMIMTGMSFVVIGTNRPGARVVVRAALAALLPWLVFYLPILTWTMLKSGSPFGPVMAGFLNADSVYDLNSIQSMIAWDRLSNSPSLATALVNLAIYSSPLVWISAAGVLIIRKIPRTTRLLALVLLGAQTLVIVFFLYFDPRFYGGILQGLLIVFVLFDQQNRNPVPMLSSMKPGLLATLLVLPWLALQLVFAAQFFPVALGLEGKSDFCDRYVSFYRDYSDLDRILPKDAVLVMSGMVRLNTVYAPRPVYFRAGDIPDTSQVFLFQVNVEDTSAVKGFRPAREIYRNSHAVTSVYRDPFRANDRGSLRVFSMVPTASSD